MTKKKKTRKEQKADQAIIDLAIERYKTGRDADKKERQEAKNDIRFAHNEDNCQWDKEILNQRKGDGRTPSRPCLSINKIPEKIDQVEGEFRQLKPSFKVRGVDSQADPIIANIYSGLIRSIEWYSDARSAYNTSHVATLHGGRGAWRIDLQDNEENPFEKDIVINRIPNPFSITWDPNAKRLDKADGNWVIVEEELSNAEYEATYPDMPLTKWSDDEDYHGWRSKNNVRIAEYWYKEKKPVTFVKVERVINGMETEIVLKKEEQQSTDTIIEEKTVEQPEVKWVKMTSEAILEGPHAWPSKLIPIVCQTGKEINVGGESKTRGMVRHAKTPQQMYNYWSSAITEQIALAPKSPYMVTAKMINKHKGQWDNAHINNYFYMVYEMDPEAPEVGPKRETPPQMSTAYAHELSRMAHDIMSAMGIYQAYLGDTSQEKSGRAIFARQRQGTTGSYAYTDNFGAALLYSMKVIIELIPEVYSSERVERIRNEENKEFAVPINARPEAGIVPQGEDREQIKEFLAAPREGMTPYVNDLSLGKYDVVVSIGPSYATQREELATVLGEIIKSMPPNVGMVLLETFIDSLDMPGSDVIIGKLKGLADAQGQMGQMETNLKVKELELEGLREMREAFESKIDAISKLMHAEAAERGQQLNEMKAFVEELRRQAGLERGAPGSSVQ